MPNQPDLDRLLRQMLNQYLDAYVNGNQDRPDSGDEPPWVDDDERPEMED